jgi:hypothetical protein
MPDDITLRDGLSGLRIIRAFDLGDGRLGQAFALVDTDGNPVAIGSEATLQAIRDRIGASTDAAATGNGSLIGITKRIRDLLTTTAAAPLAVRLSDGSAFYTASGGGSSGGTEATPLVVKGKSRIFRVLPTLTPSSAYNQFTSLGGLIELPNAVGAAGRSVLLHSVQVTCRQNLSFLRLIIFDANPTASTVANGSVINVLPADDDKVAFRFEIDAGSAIDTTTISANQASTAPLPKSVAPQSGTSLWLLCQQISSSPVTFTGAGDIKITLIGYDE